MEPIFPQAEPAPHAEFSRGADGKEYWNLTCFCGKRLLAPAFGRHKQGRCPQCGTRLLFPVERHITTGPLPVIPARRESPKPAVERIPPRKRDAGSARVKPALNAADTAADRLRPQSVRSERVSKGLVSAWPAAGFGPRALAGFVDMTLVVTFLAALLALRPFYPELLGKFAFQGAFALLIFWLNEGVLQWLANGSVGKKLAVIVLKNADGEALGATTTLLRPFVKLALLPGWPSAFLDPAGRTLHDRILGTLVLKGRAQRV